MSASVGWLGARIGHQSSMGAEPFGSPVIMGLGVWASPCTTQLVGVPVMADNVPSALNSPAWGLRRISESLTEYFPAPWFPQTVCSLW